MHSWKLIAKWGVPGTLLVALAWGSLLAPQASAAHNPCPTAAASGSACIAVDNQTTDVHSWRNPYDNTCLPNSAPGSTLYFDSTVPLNAGVALKIITPFTDNACGTAYSGTPSSNTEGPTSDNYIIYHMK